MTSLIGELPLTLLPTVAGAGTSPDVPGIFDVSIAGIGYFVDWEDQRGFRRFSAPLLRTQADAAPEVGENSINPEGPWRRTASSWHLGTGQTDYDRGESLDARFRSSKGVDVWTRWELSLLPDTTESLDSAATNLFLVPAGSRMYVADGQTLKYTTDPYAATPTYTTVTGTPASDITALASDGYRVLAAYGANGVYETNTSTGAASSWATGTSNEVAWVRGRVMVSASNSLYNPVAAYGSATALPSALFTHRNSDFTFVGFAESASHIYAAGYSGDKSEIYRITIVDDASSLGSPTVAAVLPDGEVVSSIAGYAGFVFIGTSKGVRFAIPDSAGNLTVGALIETGSTVRSFEGEGRFMWFTWETFDAVSSGLGRIDITEFTDASAGTLAYASDLMVTSTAAVTDVITFNSKRVFSISGDGVYVEDTNLVAEGQVDGGYITYGLSEAKTALDLILTHDFTDGGTVTVSLCDDREAFVSLGSTSTGKKTTLSGDEVSGSSLEVRLKLQRDSTDTTKGPTVLSSTLRVYPQVEGTKFVRVPILLDSVILGHNGVPQDFDVSAVRDELESLWASQALTSFFDGERTSTVLVADFEDSYVPPVDGALTSRGTITLTLKVAG